MFVLFFKLLPTIAGILPGFAQGLRRIFLLRQGKIGALGFEANLGAGPSIAIGVIIQ